MHLANKSCNVQHVGAGYGPVFGSLSGSANQLTMISMTAQEAAACGASKACPSQPQGALLSECWQARVKWTEHRTAVTLAGCHNPEHALCLTGLNPKP